VVAVHQPNYLPWLGYFLKMAVADVFVFHDDARLNKKGFTRRAKIASPFDEMHQKWLTIPLQSHHHGTKIAHLQVVGEHSWKRKHLAVLANNYVHTAFFRHVMPILENIYADLPSNGSLADVNICLIQALAREFGINIVTGRSAEFQYTGHPSEVNAALVLQFGGTHYLSGKGAEAYETPESYQLHGITQLPCDMHAFLTQYWQDTGKSGDPGLSVVDAWMKWGTDWIKGAITAWKQQRLRSLS
jgi:hypothetical protein